MNERDRLIELIHDSDYSLDSVRLADRLIANGVICPPCKVGDTVYYPWFYKDNKGVASDKIETIKISINVESLVLVRDGENYIPFPRVFYPENFGKTVFLTCEEAEKALKEIDENDN